MRIRVVRVLLFFFPLPRYLYSTPWIIGGIKKIQKKINPYRIEPAPSPRIRLNLSGPFTLALARSPVPVAGFTRAAIRHCISGILILLTGSLSLSHCQDQALHRNFVFTPSRFTSSRFKGRETTIQNAFRCLYEEHDRIDGTKTKYDLTHP